MSSTIPFPLADGASIFASALNYHDEYQLLQSQLTQPPYQQPPKTPIWYVKTPNTHNVSGVLTLPAGQAQVVCRPTLGVVISQAAFRLTPATVDQHIAGYVLVNDASLPMANYFRPAVRAQCADGFCMLSDLITTPLATAALSISSTHNGQLQGRNDTDKMRYSVGELLVALSEFCALNAGDVVLTGSPHNTWVTAVAGDVLRFEIASLGEPLSRLDIEITAGTTR